MSNKEAQLYEIFSSIQGEGKYIGCRQIFIRFLLCNLSCGYCDTPQSLIPQEKFRFEELPGSRKFKSFNNPASLEQAGEFIDALNKPKGIHHSVALTGGEPLLQVDFIKELAPLIKGKKIPVYLETNGTMPDRVSEILDLVDIFAIDMKLPSMTGTDKFAEHKKVLEIVAGGDVFVKIVFGKESKPLEIEQASKIVAEIDPKMDMILQPVTPHGHIKHGPAPEQMLTFYNIAKRHLENVRVIPQTQKIIRAL
ncbi:7-carboxy-7-deazaguanine synthase QueE [Candidatus Margulisiibacteriota bacterium]